MQSLELIVYNLQQAEESVVDAMDESWPLLTDFTHPVNQAIFEVSCIIFNIKTILDKLFAQHTTTNVIDFLDKSKVDYTLLLYLQLPESIAKKSELISYLRSLCSSMKADFRSRHFYDSVWNYFERKGICPVTPDKYIIANKKDELLAEYEKIKKSWGKHNPLFLQTYDTQDGKFTNHLYHITRTVQDGILRLFDILKAGEFVANGRAYKACGAFEHIIGPTTLTCQIFDCEIMSTVFDERKTTEEIKEMVKCFPQCISSIMISEDLINIEDIITYVVKERTRRIDESTVKISYHFVPNICAYKSVHREAMDVCLKECKSRIDEANAHIKGTGILPENLLFGGISDSLLALDVGAIKSNGFTTAFSRKKSSDPFSRLIYSEEVCAGATIRLHECLKEPQDLHSPNLTDDTRRMLIYTQLFTTPKREMLCYTEDALEALTTIHAQVCEYNY
jgi:nucleoid DNA-binding protein